MKDLFSGHFIVVSFPLSDCMSVLDLFEHFVAGALDEDVVVIEASPAPAVPASEEINVTSTDSEVEIVTVGDGFR